MSRRVILAVGAGLLMSLCALGLVAVGLAWRTSAVARAVFAVGMAINLPMSLFGMVGRAAFGPGGGWFPVTLSFVFNVVVWSLVAYSVLAIRVRRRRSNPGPV